MYKKPKLEQPKLTHDELVIRAERWLRNQNCGVVFNDRFQAATYSGEQPDLHIMQTNVHETNSDSFQDRILTLSLALGGPSKLAKLAGVSESVIRKWKQGKSEPTLSRLVALADVAGVSVNWLITGKAIKPLQTAAEPKGNDANNNSLLSSNKIRVMPDEDLCSIAQDTVSLLAFNPQLQNFSEKNLVAIYARGDCMEPTISEKSTLIVDTSQIDMIDGNIYVFRVSNSLVVKRVQILINKGLLLLSDNKVYRDQAISLNEVKDLDVIGRVVWIGRDV